MVRASVMTRRRTRLTLAILIAAGWRRRAGTWGRFCRRRRRRAGTTLARRCGGPRAAVSGGRAGAEAGV